MIPLGPTNSLAGGGLGVSFLAASWGPMFRSMNASGFERLGSITLMSAVSMLMSDALADRSPIRARLLGRAWRRVVIGI